ncbi:LOW QUALITY PROTEIN: hypothetical protein CVT26_013601 [Gymnopilus dilepis]|uniref:Uncharacterized protein n=1 Tax=Gymnopilus dilepis TaxID=231916 RepID=A0A409Y5P4_9AGAR|nr:LOW QUALITY PROTEIN: hypothetical protein CVT26_013601 [Gymnopilus dilepis]
MSQNAVRRWKMEGDDSRVEHGTQLSRKHVHENQRRRTMLERPFNVRRDLTRRGGGPSKRHFQSDAMNACCSTRLNMSESSAELLATAQRRTLASCHQLIQPRDIYSQVAPMQTASRSESMLGSSLLASIIAYKPLLPSTTRRKTE